LSSVVGSRRIVETSDSVPLNTGSIVTHPESAVLPSTDPATDRSEAYAPMATPRHGMGAVAIGDAIYVAGGGPQMGGGVKSVINEASSLG
jgi:hypothetical protein